MEKIQISSIIKQWQDLPNSSFGRISEILESNKKFYIANQEKTFSERLACVVNSYTTEDHVIKMLNQLGTFKFTDPEREYLYFGPGTNQPDLVGQFGHREYTDSHPVDYVEIKNVKFAANETVLRWYFNNGIKQRRLVLHGCDILVAYVEQEDALYYIEINYDNNAPSLGDIVQLSSHVGLATKLKNAKDLRVIR